MITDYITGGAYTATLFVMVIGGKGVAVHSPPSPARANFFHHDGMYARNRQPPLCVYFVTVILRYLLAKT